MSIAYEKPQEQSEEHDGKARKTGPRHEFDGDRQSKMPAAIHQRQAVAPLPVLFKVDPPLYGLLKQAIQLYDCTEGPITTLFLPLVADRVAGGYPTAFGQSKLVFLTGRKASYNHLIDLVQLSVLKVPLGFSAFYQTARDALGRVTRGHALVVGGAVFRRPAGSVRLTNSSENDDGPQ